MRLIFEDVANELLDEQRIKKYKDWITRVQAAREKGSLGEEENQYDKAEELITFYSLAPLQKVNAAIKKQIVAQILRNAGINVEINEVKKLAFEYCIEPPVKYLEYLRLNVKENPIAYIRKAAETSKKLEGRSHIDAFIETDSFLILFEFKFTSDIAPYTKFGVNRNQLARVIDVGIDHANERNKKLIVLLCSPSKLFDNHSRFYYYKIREYSDPNNIQFDLPWRTVDEINHALVKVAPVSNEDVIKAVYNNVKSYLNDNDLKDINEFFIERKLISIPLLKS
jgi:hypothetical protein